MRLGVLRTMGLGLLAALSPSVPAQESGPASRPEAPRAESRPVLPGVEEFSQLRERFEQEKSLAGPARQACLARILGRKDPEAAAFLLQNLLPEKEPSIQASMARGLAGRAADPEIAGALARHWPLLPAPARQALAHGLKAPLEPGLRAFLAGRFTQEPEAVQAGLLPAVAGAGDPEALALLGRVLQADAAYAVQIAAARLLARLPRASGRDALVEKLLSDPRPALRAEGLRALDGSDPALLLGRLREALDREVRATIRPLAGVAAALAERLAELGSPEALELFASLAACRPVGLSETLRALALRFQAPGCLEWWLSKGLKSKDPELRMLAMFALSATQEPAAVEALIRALRDPDEQARREAARSLGRMKAAGAVSALDRQLRSGPMEDRLEALDALHQIRKGEPAWTAELLRLTGSRLEGLQARALDLLAELADPEVYPKVERLGRTRSWMVRSAFYGFAAALRDPRAIPLLIERLGQETGRLKDEVESALLKIAGLTFGYDLRRWNQWWSEVKDGFVPPPPAQGPVARSSRYGNTYYGIPVVSRRVAFILDVSGSMAAKIGTGGRTRLDRAKEALAESLTRFQKETSFNVIFFHSTVSAWERQLTPALPDAMRRALAFVRSQEPTGATNLHGALELAFADPEVDTIYVLSDGSPTTGTIIEPERLLEEVLAWNRSRRIVIHTISLGVKSDLLRKLSEKSGGQSVED